MQISCTDLHQRTTEPVLAPAPLNLHGFVTITGFDGWFLLKEEMYDRALSVAPLFFFNINKHGFLICKI